VKFVVCGSLGGRVEEGLSGPVTGSIRVWITNWNKICCAVVCWERKRIMYNVITFHNE
jgi:hypothetical protein